MKKRNSKDKEFKRSIEKNVVAKQFKGKRVADPLKIQIGLVKNYEHYRQFKLGPIDQIMQGGTPLAINYRQIQYNKCVQGYMRTFYKLTDVRFIFTNLIRGSTFGQAKECFDYKIKQLTVINKKKYQQMKLTHGKDKDANNQTATHSFSGRKYLKEMELGVQKMTKKVEIGRNTCQNSSTTFIQGLVNNIQKMIKHVKEPENPLKQSDIQLPTQSHEMNTPNISRIHNDRMHTSPQPIIRDNYGLNEYLFTSKSKQRKDQMVTRSTKLNSIKQKSKQMIRFQTEYDTECIIQVNTKKSKSKSKLTSLSKKSFSKNKFTSKGKSPPLGLRYGLKLKK